MKKLRKLASLPILSVILLMNLLFYATVFVFLDDWVGLRTGSGFLNASAFTLLALLSLVSFLVAVFTDPGGVPGGYVPDVENTGGSDQELNKTDKHQRYCEKCNAYKPPRAHHCRICRRCVLRMDHHCMWINNCVGYRNYKAFFSLVAYATLSTIYSLAIIVGCALQKDWDFIGRAHLKTLYITSGAMVLLLTLTLATLLCWHIYLITHNMTTIEYYEGTRAAWLARKSGQSYHHPFDIGTYRNITLILGPSILKWLCPTALGHLKDGIQYPTVRDSL